MGEAGFIQYTIGVSQDLLNRSRVERERTTIAHVEDESHRMGQVMESLLHLCDPIHDVGLPAWVVMFAVVTLYPFAIYIGAAGSEEVFHVQVIGDDAIKAVLACRYGVGLELVVYDAWIAKGQWNLWRTKFVGGSATVAFIEDVIRVDSLPLVQSEKGRTISERAVIAMKGNVVREEHIGIGRPVGIDVIPLGRRDEIVAWGNGGRIGNMTVKHQEGVNVVPGISVAKMWWCLRLCLHIIRLAGTGLAE